LLNKNLEGVYNNCLLSKADIIKNELINYLKGYTLIDSENQQFTFINNKGEKLELVIGFNYINITRFNTHQAERIRIDDNFVISRKLLEKRENGILLKDVKKTIASSNRFQNQKVITDIFEDTYLITKDKLESLITYIDYKEVTPMNLLVSLRILETRGEIELEKISDYHNEFKTGMNYYYKNLLNDSRSYKEGCYSTKTYLNGEDVSLIYDLVDGSDKISRIYDLYNGIITQENEEDIKAISLGLLRSSAYDLKTVSGIREKEDSLIGKTLVKPDKNYLNYVKEFILTNYNSNKLDKETVVRIITLICELKFKKEELDLSFTASKVETNQGEQETSKENKFMKIFKKTFKRF